MPEKSTVIVEVRIRSENSQEHPIRAIESRTCSCSQYSTRPEEMTKAEQLAEYRRRTALSGDLF